MYARLPLAIHKIAVSIEEREFSIMRERTIRQ